MTEPLDREVDASLPDEGRDLLDHLQILAKHKRSVIGIPVGAALAALLISFAMPNVYTATSRILPPQQSSTTAASMILGQLGAFSPAGQSVGLKNPSDLYVGLLRSRTAVDGVIETHKLGGVYDLTSPTQIRAELEARTRINVGREGIITISVDDTDAARAARLSDAYVEELYKLTTNLAVSEAAQRRLFFEQQLVKAKENLANAEVALKRTQVSTGLIRVDEQAKVAIESVARLRGVITAKEVEISASRSFATGNNPDFVRRTEELRELKAQLGKLEKNQTNADAGIFVPLGKIPESGLEYIRKVRELKYHETVFEILARQFEFAKIDEAKDTSVIQLVDKAVVPDRKTKPRRGLITSIAFLLGFVVMLVIVYGREAYSAARSDPFRSSKLAKIRQYLRTL
jgi:tyrosine-protein kinase Etk/Wzc